MAVTKDAVASVSSTAGGTTLTLSSFTIANNSNRALVLFAGNSEGAGGKAHSNWSWNGSTAGFTELEDTAFGSFYGLGAAILVAPTATTANAAVTFSASPDESMLIAYSAYNVDQTTPNGTAVGSTQSTTSPWGACASAAGEISLCFIYSDGTAIAAVDGIPQYIAVGTASQSAGATSLTPTGAPAGRILGDLEFCSIATENNATISVTAAGWNKIGSTVQQDASWQEELWYRIYNGSNTDPDFSWSGSVGCSARRWIFRDGAVSGTLFGFHNTNSGNTSTHSRTGSNATGNDSTVMYLSHAEANTALGADADYTERFDAGSNTGPYRLVVGQRDQATSGAGAADFSATGANASWVMRLLEIFNSNAGDQATEDSEENIGGFVSGELASEAGDTYNQFGFTVTAGGECRTVAFSLKEAADGGQQTITASDSLGIGVTDAYQANALTLSIQDSLKVQLTEATHIVAMVSVADSAAAGITDAATQLVAVLAVSDALAVQLTDAYSVLLGLVPAEDSLTVGLTDVFTGSQALATADSAAVQSTELASALNAFSATDTLAAGLTDLATSLAAVITASESCAAQADETGAALTSSVSAQETLTVGVTDTFTGSQALTALDTVAAQLAEAASVSSSVSASDGTAVRLTDDAVPGITLSASDGLAVQLEEAASVIQNTLISTTDALAVQLTEVAHIDLALSVADSLAVQALDLFTGSQALSVSDDLSNGVFEDQFSSLPTAASDMASLALSDVASVGVTFTSIDDLVVQLEEAASQQAADTAIPKSVQDSLTAQCEDSAAMAVAGPYWSGTNGDEYGLVYVDSYQTGHRENPGKMRW